MFLHVKVMGIGETIQDYTILILLVRLGKWKKETRTYNFLMTVWGINIDRVLTSGYQPKSSSSVRNITNTDINLQKAKQVHAFKNYILVFYTSIK